MTTLADQMNAQAARGVADAIRTVGTPITVGGVSCRGVFKALSSGETQLLPDGGRNAADGDAVAVGVSPLDFPSGVPGVGALVTRTADGQGYTVAALRPVVRGLTTVETRLLCYRTPTGPQDAATDAQAAEWADPPAQ